MEACILSLQERTDHMEVHSDAQDAHRNAIDARLRQTDASADQTRIRLEKAEEALREAGLLASELHLFNKKSYSQAGEDAILMYISSCWVYRFHSVRIWIWGQITPVI